MHVSAFFFTPMTTTPQTMLFADSGSTKTDWLITTGNGTPQRIRTQGINPFMLSDDEVEQILRNELLSAEDFSTPTAICFYGAGCRGEGTERMERIFRKLFPNATDITVGSDLIGTAKALIGGGSGIACILGTGSNSCLVVDGQTVANVSPLGYVLGDEGSGAVLGRRLIGDVLKKQLPEHVCKAFHDTYTLTGDEIISRVYREPFGNRFLASFAPFLHAHREEPAVRALLLDEFARFFRRNVLLYRRTDLPVSFTGSIAYHFREELAMAAEACGCTLGRILQSPLDGIQEA